MRCGHGGLVLAASVFVCAGVRADAPLPRVRDLAGRWESSVDGTNKKCRILPRPEFSVAAHWQISIHRACLGAFPILAPVDVSRLTGDDRLVLSGHAGQTVLDFAATAGAAFVAIAPRDETFRLAAIHDAAQNHEPFAKQGANPVAANIATKQDSPAAAPADAAGRYSILRDGGKDTGCMLTLAKQVKAPGRAKASLAPGCRDQGIVIFDPAGWQIVNGRLVLTARKGHKTHLDAQPDGTWKKDPKEGKSLILKKL
ncbi:MAG: AprI/Inh family metalloprotease inhibitor [Methylocella sp.]